jgi:hypothetical protein
MSGGCRSAEDKRDGIKEVAETLAWKPNATAQLRPGPMGAKRLMMNPRSALPPKLIGLVRDREMGRCLFLPVRQCNLDRSLDGLTAVRVGFVSGLIAAVDVPQPLGDCRGG